jgi:hypothetical protein
VFAFILTDKKQRIYRIEERIYRIEVCEVELRGFCNRLLPGTSAADGLKQSLGTSVDEPKSCEQSCGACGRKDKAQSHLGKRARPAKQAVKLRIRALDNEMLERRRNQPKRRPAVAAAAAWIRVTELF